MEKEISWTAEVGKKAFLARLKKPKTIFSFAVGLIIAMPLIAGLVSTLENDFKINPTISYSIIFGLCLFLAFYIYKTNRLLLGKNTIVKYSINDKRITLNDESHLWKEYQYFQNEHLLGEKVTPTILKNIKPDAYIISLLKKRSDKGKLVLIMENQDIYEKVSRLVSSKLHDALDLK